MAFDKDKAIMAQNSATAAAAIVASLGISDVAQATSTFDDVRQHIFRGTLELAGVETVIETFEGPLGGATANPGFTEPQAPTLAPATSSAPIGGGAGSVVIKFGKYRNQSLQAIYDQAPDYVEWLAEKGNNEFMKNKAREFLAEVA